MGLNDLAKCIERVGGHRLAAFTMARNEPKFLPLWLEYYCRQLPAEDVWVLDNDSDDGSAADAAARFPGVHFVPIHRAMVDWLWLMGMAKRFQEFLLQSYRTVLYADLDEFVVAEPRKYSGLADFADRMAPPSTRCLGLNVRQELGEPPLDWGRPVLSQRPTCWFSSDYSKTLLSREPLDWHPGFHVAEGVELSPNPELFLLHLHRADYATCLERHRACAGRKWDERCGKFGAHYQIHEPEEFHRWFYGSEEYLGETMYALPAQLRDVF